MLETCVSKCFERQISDAKRERSDVRYKSPLLQNWHLQLVLLGKGSFLSFLGLRITIIATADARSWYQDTYLMQNVIHLEQAKCLSKVEHMASRPTLVEDNRGWLWLFTKVAGLQVEAAEHCSDKRYHGKRMNMVLGRPTQNTISHLVRSIGGLWITSLLIRCAEVNSRNEKGQVITW